jgi:hypothetical protein
MGKGGFSEPPFASGDIKNFTYSLGNVIVARDISINVNEGDCRMTAMPVQRKIRPSHSAIHMGPLSPHLGTSQQAGSLAPADDKPTPDLKRASVFSVRIPFDEWVDASVVWEGLTIPKRQLSARRQGNATGTSAIMGKLLQKSVDVQEQKCARRSVNFFAFAPTTEGHSITMSARP